MERRGKRYQEKQRGAGLVEYVILVAMISVTAMNAVRALGDKPKEIMCTVLWKGQMANVEWSQIQMQQNGPQEWKCVNPGASSLEELVVF